MPWKGPLGHPVRGPFPTGFRTYLLNIYELTGLSIISKNYRNIGYYRLCATTKVAQKLAH